MQKSIGSAVGIDVGGSALKGAVLDPAGQCRMTAKVPTAGRSRAAVEAAITQLWGELSSAWGEGESGGGELSAPSAVGIGLPGQVEGPDGLVVVAPGQFPELGGWRAAAFLRERFQLPAAAENDANAAGYAEACLGAGRDEPSALTVTVGTGLGGALVLGGELWRGRASGAGEIGHLRFRPGGHACRAHPGGGCLERYASATALGERAKALGMRVQSAREVIEAALADDALALRAVRDVGLDLGRGLAMAATLLAPHVIVVGGGVSVLGERLLVPVREGLAEGALPAVTTTPVRLAALGNDAGSIGAAALARLASPPRC